MKNNEMRSREEFKHKEMSQRERNSKLHTYAYHLSMYKHFYVFLMNFYGSGYILGYEFAPLTLKQLNCHKSSLTAQITININLFIMYDTSTRVVQGINARNHGHKNF